MNKSTLLTGFLLMFSISLMAQSQHKLLKKEPPDPIIFEIPDSIVTINPDGTPKEKKLFKYNDNNKLLSFQKYLWNTSDSLWQGVEREEWEYDNSDNVTLNIVYEWNDTINNWVGKYKIERAFDAKGNRTLSAIYLWNKDDNDWRGEGSKNEYVYATRERHPTTTATYKWNEEKKDWEPKRLEETYYNQYEDFIYGIEYKGVDGDWKLKSKNERYYNVKRKITGGRSYRWDDDTNDWITEFKYENTYDILGRRTCNILYQWREEYDRWAGLKTEYIYESEEKRKASESIKYKWNDITNEWVE